MATQEQEKSVRSVARTAYPNVEGVETSTQILMVLEFLEDNEVPEACFLTSLCLRGSTRIGESGCLWATNKRLLFVAWVSVFTKKPIMLAFPHNTIESMDVSSGSLLGFGSEKILCTIAQHKYTFISSQKGHTSDFADYVLQRRFSETGTMPNTTKEESDLTAQLEKLASLREKGMLSEEEFTQAKKQILQ